MNIKAIHVTIEEVIDAGITLGMSARAVAKLAREAGYRFDNNQFLRQYRAQKRKRQDAAA